MEVDDNGSILLKRSFGIREMGAKTIHGSRVT